MKPLLSRGFFAVLEKSISTGSLPLRAQVNVRCPVVDVSSRAAGDSSQGHFPRSADVRLVVSVMLHRRSWSIVRRRLACHCGKSAHHHQCLVPLNSVCVRVGPRVRCVAPQAPESWHAALRGLALDAELTPASPGHPTRPSAATGLGHCRTTQTLRHRGTIAGVQRTLKFLQTLPWLMSHLAHLALRPTNGAATEGV